MAGNYTAKSYESAVVPLSRGGVELIIACVVITALATLWTGLRLHSRIHLRRTRILLEDYLTLVALFMLYIEATSICLMTVLGGIGHHSHELQPSHVAMMLKLSFGMQISYALGLCLVKCSICQTLARIFFLTPVRVAAYVAMGLAISWALMTIFTGLFICRPLQAFWDPTVPGGHCGNQNTAFAAVGIVDVSIDIIIMILPIPMVWKLQIPKANRIGVACIFALGIITITVGILRTVTILEMDFMDATWSSRIPALLTITELGVAIIVASSPIMRPLFDRIFVSLIPAVRSRRESSFGLSDGSTIHAYNQMKRGQISVDEMDLDGLEQGTLGSAATPTSGDRVTPTPNNSLDVELVDAEESRRAVNTLIQDCTIDSISKDEKT